VAVDSAGNVYVADAGNSTIREVTPAGAVTTLAGMPGSNCSADGTGSAACFNGPYGVAVDGAGNVYVADTWNCTIRQVTPAGVVTTSAGLAWTLGSADGTGDGAQFDNPQGVAVDSAGNVYVADTGNNTIREMTTDGTNWTVTTLAGTAGNSGSADGMGSAAQFNHPSGVAVDSAGNVYVADTGNNTIRRLTPAGEVTTLAGLAGSSGSADGTGRAAQFDQPSGVAVDGGGNVYVADTFNYTIRKVTRAGVVTTLAGKASGGGSGDGTGNAARFGLPCGVAVDGAGNVYVADAVNGTICKVTEMEVVTPAGVVTTLAGVAGSIGSADGTGSAAQFHYPSGVAADGAGNVYVADTFNYTIRKVTPGRAVTTLAGLAGSFGGVDGTGSAARFYLPKGVAVDSAGNVYVADTSNHTIREVTPAGVVTTLAGLARNIGSADGTGSAARFSNPQGVAVDGAGNVYVADSGNHTIRKVTPAGTNWVVTTLAGTAGIPGSADGTGNAAQFYYPCGVAVDNAGNVYVADSDNDTIRKVTPAGAVTTLAGLARNAGSADGAGSVARFASPQGVAVDGAGNVYVADTGNDTIRQVTPAGVVTTFGGLAGSRGSADGTGSAARFNGPSGVAVGSAGDVYVADYGNNTLRQMTPAEVVTTAGVVTTLAGQRSGNAGSADGTGSAAQFHYPGGLAVDSAGNVYVADTSNNAIREVTPAGVVTTLAGLARPLFGSADGTGSAAQFFEPCGVAVDSAGNLYVADSGNHTIRKVTPVGTNWVVTTLAGMAGISGGVDGTDKGARFNSPDGVAVDSAGNLYVADTRNHTIRGMTLRGTNWVVTTLAGTAGSSGSADGTGNAAQFYFPGGVAVDTAGNVYVADTGNDTIREITPDGTNWVVTTLAGLAGNPGSADEPGSGSQFYQPSSVAVDGAGNIYVADSFNNTIRELIIGVQTTTLAGVAPSLAASGSGNADGTGSNAQFNSPFGVAVDSAGNIYVADSGNSTIRKGVPSTSVPPPVLQPPKLAAGQFSFGITGLSGLAVDIYSSGDLQNWQWAGTYVLEGGTNYFVSPTPAQGTQFYQGYVR
jgi:hypothetical protein